MTKTLYRKYRPQFFSDVVGQEHITKTLLNQIKSGQIAHAYLFSGPRGIGKTTTARLLAKAVNAHDPQTGEPDNQALINISITEGRSLDLVEIDAASNRRIEEVRELREHVKYPPNEAKYKVFIIDEVHMLTPEAFNALLKTLEEPPSYVIFILATTELQKLPETIISRCQRFDFKKVKPLVLENRLRTLAQKEGVVVAPTVLQTIVKISDGCVRDAESYLGQILSMGDKNITVDQASLFLPKSSGQALVKLWQALVNQERARVLNAINELVKEGFDIEYFYNEWLELLRLIMLWKIDPNFEQVVYLLSEEEVKDVKNTLDKITISEISLINRINLNYKDYFELVPLPQMVLELAAIESINKLKTTNNDPSDSGRPSSTTTKADQQTATEDDQSQLPARWQKTIDLVSQQTLVLGQYLRTAEVTVQGSIFEISTSHPFQYEIISKKHHLLVIKNHLSKVFEQDFNLRVKLCPVENKSTTKDNIAANLLNAFGGEVVGELLEK